MKKTFLLSILIISSLFASTTDMKAQYNGHEFEVGVGVWSSNDIIFALADMMVSAIPNDVNIKESSSIGAFHVGYKYLFTERFGLGGTFTYGREKSNGYHSAGDFAGNLKRNHYTLGVEADFKYYQHGIFDIYGLAGLGVTYFNQSYVPVNGAKSKDDKWHPNLQLTPIAVKMGNAFGVFVELGIGYKGILNAGLFLRL